MAFNPVTISKGSGQSLGVAHGDEDGIQTD
jgi:hypothetical protein